ncbi:MAG: hypothetical protein J6W30_10165 [Bacteroidales bacterium]|nr:hypothetical protein [Bacteroidales bacterium]
MEEQQMPVLRFGIMVDDLTMEAWKVETVRKLIEGGMRLELIIRNAETTRRKRFFKWLFHYPFRRGFFQIWNHYQFKPESKKMTELEPMLESLGLNRSEIPLLDCKPSHKRTSTFILDKDIETIKNHQLDFILRFGFDIIRGEILQSAKFGIWSFHHDDEMAYRGAPPGFWEWMQDNPRNGVILQRLTESLDKGYILKKRWYPTILHSYKAHLDQLYLDSTDMPLQVCREIQFTGQLNEYLSESTAKIYRPPVNIKMLQYWILCLTRRLRFHLHDIFRQEDWNVGYVEVPLKEFVKEPEIHEEDVVWFKRKRKSIYSADPFVITTEKDTYIFFESYDYKAGKGHIEVVRRSKGYKKPKVALEEPFHLSYPFVFQHDGVVYCIPESHEANRLNLYRFNEKELKLEQECVLMEHVRAIDPTLIYRDGKWNLFFTQKDFPSVKLYRFVAEDLKGTYYPHHGNPVKVDCADARMAGAFFELDGDLIRPAQECVRYYGTAVNLNRVDALTDKEYIETQYDKIKPFVHSKYKQGFHTLNGNEVVTVFDAKRWRFTLFGMFHQVRNKMHRNKTHV